MHSTMLLIAATVPDPSSVAWWIETFGPYGFVAFTAGGLLWKLCMFLKPYFIEIVQGHVDLMKALEKTQIDQTDLLRDVRKTQDDHGQKIDDIHKAVVTK